ncbi:FAD-binding protein [Chloroflexota bacterium]
MVEKRVITTDVLVVGNGGAGARAAIEVARNNLKVIMAAKGMFTRCGATVTADMDVDVPSKEAKEVFGFDGDITDTVESFAQNMFDFGDHMNNEEIVLTHCSNATKYVKELIDSGMKVLGFWKGPGHTVPRGILSTGRSMMATLKRMASQCKIDIADHTMITNLLTSNGRVIGAAGLDIRSGDFLVIKTKAVVLATGGAQRLYRITTAPEELTGEGLTMAYQVGAELVDMEFPRFNHSCLYWPESMQGIIYSRIAPDVGGWWLNMHAERFMAKWDPVKMERGLPYHKSSSAQSLEIVEGRASPHGGIFITFKHLPDEVLEYAMQNFPWWHNFTYGNFNMLEFGMDPRKVAYEGGPACHYFCGGIKVNGRGETGVPGLYAAGEIQGGTMGAGRLIGNAITECLVFGALAGGSAANYAKSVSLAEVDKYQADMYYEQVHKPLTLKDGVNVFDTRRKLQDLAHRYLSPVRDESGLATCIKEAESLKEDVLSNQATRAKGKVYNCEWVAALENRSLLQVMEIIARASLMRTESRGCMYRRDYPDTDNKDWLRNIIVKNRDGQISLETKPVVTSVVKLPDRKKVPYMV